MKMLSIDERQTACENDGVKLVSDRHFVGELRVQFGTDSFNVSVGTNLMHSLGNV